jgi:hypothetical protein
MAFQSTSKFLPGSRWVLGSILFVANKFGDLSLQESKSREVNGSGTGHLPPAPVQVGLINEPQLRHGSEPGKANQDPSRDKADHILVVLVATTNPIYQSSPESNYEGNREVYIVENREEPLEKTVEEIQWEAEEEIACVAHLAKEAERGKKHNGLQDDSGVLDDEPRDGAPTRTHHPKFMINPRGNGLDRVLGRVGLPHSGKECLGLKDAHRSAHSPPAKGQRRS